MLITDTIKSTSLSSLFDEIGKSLDITKNQHELIEQRYKAVARHLDAENSLLKPYKPTILPQGSFLLGTMVRPVNDDDDIDVDLVCRLHGKKAEWAQYGVKKTVGDQIKTDEDYKRMLDEEGRRCWTLIYAESSKFHLDILPALVNNRYFTLLERSFASLNQNEIDDLSVRITDKTRKDFITQTDALFWPKSNPFGYAGWFKNRAQINMERVLLTETVQQFPNYQLDKMPLQRIVQILKRHRDIMFGGDENKPISIIITTLAALAYRKETNIFEGLLNVLSTMEQYIKTVYSSEYEKEIKWIENPVNTIENFADRWPTEPDKEKAFYYWLKKAQQDFAVLIQGDSTQSYRILKEILGSRAVNEGYRSAGMTNLISEKYYPVSFNRLLLDVPHRQQPIWPVRLTHLVEVHGNYRKENKLKTITPDTIVPKGSDIYFNATTNVSKPFDVYWQVVNTGSEANIRNGLRGSIFHSKTAGAGGLHQKEYSQFTGNHWIECFIVKNGVCIARSYEFLVNIE